MFPRLLSLLLLSSSCRRARNGSGTRVRTREERRELSRTRDFHNSPFDISAFRGITERRTITIICTYMCGMHSRREEIASVCARLFAQLSAVECADVASRSRVRHRAAPITPSRDILIGVGGIIYFPLENLILTKLSAAYILITRYIKQLCARGEYSIRMSTKIREL